MSSDELLTAREESSYYRRWLRFQKGLERDRERAREEQAKHRALSEEKGYSDTRNRLGNHTSDEETAEKNAQVRTAKRRQFHVLVPRWKDATDYQKLEEIVRQLIRLGAKRVHLNLTEEVQQKVRAQGITPFRNRLRTDLKRALGHVPPFVMALDDDAGRLHFHGVIVVTAETERRVKRALRRAAGAWQGPMGNRRQLVIDDKLTEPGVWADYMLKSHNHLHNLPGPLVTWTNNVRRLAKAVMEERCSTPPAWALDIHPFFLPPRWRSPLPVTRKSD